MLIKIKTTKENDNTQGEGNLFKAEFHFHIKSVIGLIENVSCLNECFALIWESSKFILCFHLESTLNDV